MEYTIGLAAIGALIALDHAMLGQFMLSQPIVTGAIFGLLFNDLQSGIMIGAMIQLLWVGILPVGAFIPSDHTVTGGITACLALILITQFGIPLSRATILSLAVAIPAGYLSGKLDILVRQFNSRWNAVVDQNLKKNPVRIINTIAMAGLSLTFLRNFILYIAWLTMAAWLVIRIGVNLPALAEKGLDMAFWLLPAVSFAVIVDLIMKEKLLWWTIGSMILVLPLMFIWPGRQYYFMPLIMMAGLLITLGRKSW